MTCIAAHSSPARAKLTSAATPSLAAAARPRARSASFRSTPPPRQPSRFVRPRDRHRPQLAALSSVRYCSHHTSYIRTSIRRSSATVFLLLRWYQAQCTSCTVHPLYYPLYYLNYSSGTEETVFLKIVTIRGLIINSCVEENFVTMSSWTSESQDVDEDVKTDTYKPIRRLSVQ